MDPWNDATFTADKRAAGRDWPSVAHTMVGTARLQNLRALMQRVLDENIPGDVIETGVWRGGCCILMKGVLSVYGDNARRVFVADSFEGLPPPAPEKYPADLGDPHHTFTQLAVGENEVRENFTRYGLLDDKVVFLKGYFEQTLCAVPSERFALLRLDGDMYSSTIVALEALYPKLSPGGFVIIDDYGCVPACKLAVDDYRKANGIDDPITEIDWAGVWWQKSVPNADTVAASLPDGPP